jgi:hypothetical protein
MTCYAREAEHDAHSLSWPNCNLLVVDEWQMLGTPGARATLQMEPQCGLDELERCIDMDAPYNRNAQSLAKEAIVIFESWAWTMRA